MKPQEIGGLLLRLLLLKIIHFSFSNLNLGWGGVNKGWEGYGRRERTEGEAGEKFKLSLFVTAYHPVKVTNPITFLDFHLTFSEA